MSAGLSIGQVAERTELSVHALRFYEREGILVGPVRRDHNGRRVYHESDVEWLTICTWFRVSGMSLPTIRRYAELVRQGVGNEKNRLAILREHEERVIGQIRALSESLDTIKYLASAYESRIADGSATGLWTTSFGAAQTAQTDQTT
ncbi:MerR family transcriptional regulator [Fodinicola feengrottensis]|uniref:MerR family transcriptional regulator n=1 Tax=Fodinicola feengrottensis TaxID=435914 RepID=A0ABP4RNX3_9ACTN|nr:MerR family transcriptional regulator [Fodinicola feengrottensis]